MTLILMDDKISDLVTRLVCELYMYMYISYTADSGRGTIN